MSITLSFPVTMTIISGRLFCPLDDLYKALSQITEDGIYTHQIPRALDACAPWLFEQCPILHQQYYDEQEVNVIIAECDGDVHKGLGLWQETIHKKGLPESFEVAPLPPGRWVMQNPITELAAMVGEKPIIVVTP